MYYHNSGIKENIVDKLPRGVIDLASGVLFRQEKVAPISYDLRWRIWKYFAQDVKSLENVTGLNLDRWGPNKK